MDTLARTHPNASPRTSSRPTSDRLRTRRSFLYAGGRILLAALFIGLGISRLVDLTSARELLNVAGFGSLLVTVCVAVELLGGVILALGWKLREASRVMIGYLVALSALAHHDLSRPETRAVVTSHLAIIAGLMMLRARGAGSRSIDHLLEAREGR